MGKFSKELCGGTHLTNTREVGAFEILSEEGVSAGTRRVTALTGRRAADHGTQVMQTLERAAQLLGCAAAAVPGKVTALLHEQRELRKVLASGGTLADNKPGGASTVVATERPSPSQAKSLLTEAAHLLSVAPLAVAERLAAVVDEVHALHQRLDERAAAGPITADGLLQSATKLGDATIVVAETPTVEPNLMRQLIDQIRQKTGSSAVLLATSEGDDKVTLVAGVSKDLQDRGAHAGNWVKPVAQALGGGGGGRPDMAQAGGKRPDKLPEALELARQTIKEMLSA
jgi:alanyl-tRNA synthetase